MRSLQRILNWGGVAVVVIGVGAFWRNHGHELDPFRTQVNQSVREECTNVVTGLRSIIRQDAETSPSNLAQWAATATVEYVNHQGGMDRTNLDFTFEALLDKLVCHQHLQRP